MNAFWSVAASSRAISVLTRQERVGVCSYHDQSSHYIWSKKINPPAGEIINTQMPMDHAGKKVDVVVVGNVDGERVAGNGQDIDEARHNLHEPAADHLATRGLAIGFLIQELMVEGLASFLVVFWSCVAAVMQEMYQTLTFPMVCLVVALAVAFVLSWLGPAHFNPAVTVTFAAYRRFPWRKMPLYVAVQLAGSLLACLSVNGVMSPRDEHFYGTAPMAGHGTRLPFLMEFLASAVLMIVIATVATGSAGKTEGGVAIGAAVGGLGLVIGPVSGGSMDPARTLGPAIVLGRYDGVWIYVVAPVAGMLVGALCNRTVRLSHRIVAFLCGAGSTPHASRGSVGIAGAHAVPVAV